MRIVSLLPSATEIVCSLGLRDQLVGVTHECDHPPFVRELPKVTRTLIPHEATSSEIDALIRERLKTDRALYTLDMPVLETLHPDVIVTQALCDVCAVAETEVTQAACNLPGKPRVINLEPMTLSEVFHSIRQVGLAVGLTERAEEVVAQLQVRVEAVVQRSQTLSQPIRVVHLEWIDPPFCSGHWSPELIRLAGGEELIGREGQPSRTTQWEEIRQTDPEVMFIACCGFPAERALLDFPKLVNSPGFFELACVRSNRVYLSDGNAYFNRPGPRLVDSLEILAHALSPVLHPLPPGLSPARQLSGEELRQLQKVNS